MSEERSIEKLINDQIKIFRNNGIKNKSVTISVPKVTLDKRVECPDVEIASLIVNLIKVLGYEPTVMNSTIFYSDNMATIIVTFLFNG